MLTTTVLVATFLGLLIASLILWGLCLRLGLRWAKAPEVTTGRIVIATGAVFLCQIAISALSLLITSFAPLSDAQSLSSAFIELGIVVAVSGLIIGSLFKLPFPRAMQAWLPTLLTGVVAITFVYFVLRPFIFEGFIVPTNAMAPTLVGNHQCGVCPDCGEPSYTTPREAGFDPPRKPLAICGKFHVRPAEKLEQQVHAGDRFLVGKYLAPRRWDLIVFQSPEQPEINYVKRIVGLPGETITIEDGSIWVDGKRMSPPEPIRNIEYLNQLSDWQSSDLWGSPNRPAKLGNDEYFVLGDFSAQSRDSRFWEEGAAGHQPFAVPKSHLIGVVTHTYWPTERWRIHR